MGKTAIVLAGIKPHSILIEKLKNRGFYTILVDYLDNPPASSVADEHVQISTHDYEAVRQLALERKADLVINCCLEFLNVTVSKIAEELNLPKLYSYETALNVSDKVRMKHIMRDNDIPTTKFITVGDIKELEDFDLTYPVFTKPADGSGSTGVSRADNKKELYEFTEQALYYSKSHVAIVEEAATGIECNVYCSIQDGKAKVLAVSRKFSIIGGKNDVTRAIGSLWPADISENAYGNISLAVQKIADAFKLYTTPMFMQILVNGDEINIIEFACRMAGGYSYRNILNKYHFDYFDFTIDAFLGVHNELNIIDTGEHCAINSLYATPCYFDHIDGLEDLKARGIVKDYMLPRNPGTKISSETQRTEKIGYFIVVGQSKDEVFDKVQYVFDHIEAYDTDGAKVLRRDSILNKSML